jgi:hypothetical protein
MPRGNEAAQDAADREHDDAYRAIDEPHLAGGER